MKKFTYVFGIFLMCACSGKEPVVEEPEVDEAAEIQAQIEAAEELNKKARNLLDNTCFTCHNKNLAPPIEEVKTMYISDSVSKEEFVEKMVHWVFNPTEKESRMPEARKKWGLMPKQEFKEEDVRLVAGYIYDNDLSGIIIP